jgi:hypothetical protein
LLTFNSKSVKVSQNNVDLGKDLTRC